MPDLKDLSKDMMLLASSIDQRASKKAQRVALAVIDDLILATPVDTGAALSNWQTTLDAPAATIIPAFVPSPKGRKVQGVWVHRVDPHFTAVANTPGVIAALQTAIQAKQPGQPIFITNNIEYIAELNDGSSTQAPSGFVDRAMIVANNTP